MFSREELYVQCLQAVFISSSLPLPSVLYGPAVWMCSQRAAAGRRHYRHFVFDSRPETPLRRETFPFAPKRCFLSKPEQREEEICSQVVGFGLLRRSSQVRENCMVLTSQCYSITRLTAEMTVITRYSHCGIIFLIRSVTLRVLQPLHRESCKPMCLLQ